MHTKYLRITVRTVIGCICTLALPASSLAIPLPSAFVETSAGARIGATFVQNGNSGNPSEVTDISIGPISVRSFASATVSPMISTIAQVSSSNSTLFGTGDAAAGAQAASGFYFAVEGSGTSPIPVTINWSYRWVSQLGLDSLGSANGASIISVTNENQTANLASRSVEFCKVASNCTDFGGVEALTVELTPNQAYFTGLLSVARLLTAPTQSASVSSMAWIDFSNPADQVAGNRLVFSGGVANVPPSPVPDLPTWLSLGVGLSLVSALIRKA